MKDHVILTRHDDHRRELIMHCFAFILLLFALLPIAPFDSKNSFSIPQTGRIRGDW